MGLKNKELGEAADTGEIQRRGRCSESLWLSTETLLKDICLMLWFIS